MSRKIKLNANRQTISCTLIALCAFAWTASAEDWQIQTAKESGHWPQWRGPNRDNVATDTNLLQKWPQDGPPLLWRVEGLGEGIASVSIVNGRVFTLGYRDDLEYVSAVSEVTGEQLWMTAIGPSIAENRLMRWLGQRTPTVDEARLYAMRSDGDLICLDVTDGRELWHKSYTKEFGTKRHGWGICDYPLVDGERLICVPGGSEATIVALNRISGDLIWKTSVGEKEPSGYAAMIVSEGAGVRQFVAILRDELVGVAADNGKVLWRYDKISRGRAASVSPLARKNWILSYNGYGSSLVLLKLIRDGSGVKVEKEYSRTGGISPFQDSTMWVGDDVYTFARRGLDRYDALTGERRPIGVQLGKGFSAMTYADGNIILRTSDGTVSLIDTRSDDLVDKSRFTIPDHESAMGATNPVVTGGRLYLRDDDRLFCYDVQTSAFESPGVPTLIILEPRAKEGLTKKMRHTRSVFVPTPQDIVEKMLELAAVKKSDVVYDLGSGDGRIVITAARKIGCKAVGYEIDKELVAVSRKQASEAGVAKLVTIEQANIHEVDLSRADVIAVYLHPKQLASFVPQLRNLRPGVRIVSHQFQIPGVEPNRTVEATSTEDGETHMIHLCETPLRRTK